MASTLEPLSPHELRKMVAFRWSVASGGAQHPFTDDSFAVLYEHSRGMPREANILADNAVLLAHHRQLRSIDAELIGAVAADRAENLARKEAA